MALYLDEVDVIRRALGLEHAHILGHSWGGMLAMEYALTQSAGLESLILADTGASMPQWVAEMRRLVAELPPEVQKTIQRGIPGSEWVIFENNGHFPHIEETARYLQEVGKFMTRVEAQTIRYGLGIL